MNLDISAQEHSLQIASLGLLGCNLVIWLLRLFQIQKLLEQFWILFLAAATSEAKARVAPAAEANHKWRERRNNDKESDDELQLLVFRALSPIARVHVVAFVESRGCLI